MGKALFITGTGIGVGKTYVAALIIKRLKDAGLDAGYYKAAISGAEKDEEDGTLHAGDALYVKEGGQSRHDRGHHRHQGHRDGGKRRRKLGHGRKGVSGAL